MFIVFPEIIYKELETTHPLAAALWDASCSREGFQHGCYSAGASCGVASSTVDFQLLRAVAAVRNVAVATCLAVACSAIVRFAVVR